jgi:ComF family protein
LLVAHDCWHLFAGDDLVIAVRYCPMKLPSLCAICLDWAGHRICDACIARFARHLRRCVRCAIGIPDGTTTCGECITRPPTQDAALSALDYDPPWSRLIGQFKFREGLDLADAFVSRMEAAWVDRGRPEPGVIVPVPLSAARLRVRGYNQAWELARRMARRLGAKAEPAWLLRVRDTLHQTALPLDRRAANVKDAFMLDPGIRRNLSGQTITVIDDVWTTGATMGEVARVLKNAGAFRVNAWVLARTPAPGG